MFTKQVNQLDALLSAGADPVLVDCIRGIIGNCQAALLHRGQVAIEASRAIGAADGALEVSNFNLPPEDNYTIAPSNGKALWVKNGLTCFDGPVRGGFFWAKATATHTMGSAGPSRDSTVACSLCSDSAGTLVAPTRSVTVYLPRTQTQDPNVRSGDVIAIFLDHNGYAHCIDGAVMDGKIGEVRSLVSGTPGDYASGLRGWYLADGTDSTVNLGGGSLQGYTGAGAWTTVGATITQSATGTISAHAVSGTDAAATVTATGGGTTISITVDNNTTGISISTSSQIDLETNPATAGDPSFIQSFSDPGHGHTATATKSNIVGAFTVSTTDDNIVAAIANHTFTSTTVTPPGIVALFIQRMN